MLDSPPSKASSSKLGFLSVSLRPRLCGWHQRTKQQLSIVIETNTNIIHSFGIPSEDDDEEDESL